jgi:hypothetical protein
MVAAPNPMARPMKCAKRVAFFTASTTSPLNASNRLSKFILRLSVVIPLCVAAIVTMR